MVDEITIRQATLTDVLDLVRLRRMMFEAMGWNDPAQLDAGDAAAATYFAEAIPAGTFHGWLFANNSVRASSRIYARSSRVKVRG